MLVAASWKLKQVNTYHAMSFANSETDGDFGGRRHASGSNMMSAFFYLKELHLKI